MIEEAEAVRSIVRTSVEAYASGFADRHVAQSDNPNGTINMKIHNVFISALGPEIQYYSALARSLDSSLGNMLEKMAINISSLLGRYSKVIEQDMGDIKWDSYFWSEVCGSESGLETIRQSIKDCITENLLYGDSIPEVIFSFAVLKKIEENDES